MAAKVADYLLFSSVADKLLSRVSQSNKQEQGGFAVKPLRSVQPTAFSVDQKKYM